MKLQPVIGMEIHVELKTKSKMFCSCDANHFGKDPNTQTCPVCLGLPGALPVPNKKAIQWTIQLGYALDCNINTISKFDRKHYFYPDLPKGYQISQYDEPLCYQGKVETSLGTIGITRVHLEEDTAKSQHTLLDGHKVTLVDFNRSSVPLVEIVTEPDIKTAKQAREYAEHIQKVCRFLGISDADMEKGSMRLEANISLGLDLGYKVEVKNINSFRFLEKAIEYELKRQRELLDQGQTPPQETRGFNERKMATFSQRSKEDSQDYRYFPEPDIPPLHFDQKYLDNLRQNLPPLSKNYAQKFSDLHIRSDYITSFTQTPEKAQFMDQLFTKAQDQKLDVADLAKFCANQKLDSDLSVNEIIKTFTQKSAQPTATNNQMTAWVQAAIDENPDLVVKYKSGKTSVIGAFIGPIMQKSRGQADPKVITKIIQELLKE